MTASGKLSGLSAVALAVAVTACTNTDPVYAEYNISVLCSSALDCGGVGAPAVCGDVGGLTHSICVLERQNGQPCPRGGLLLAWGEAARYLDGHTVVTEAHFGCVRDCNDDCDCPTGTVCREGGCFAPLP